MEDECLVCVEPASDRYTVSMENSRTFERKILCDECVSDLRDEEWIDVRDEPVLARDGSGTRENEAK